MEIWFARTSCIPLQPTGGDNAFHKDREMGISGPSGLHRLWCLTIYMIVGSIDESMHISRPHDQISKKIRYNVSDRMSFLNQLFGWLEN